MRVLVRQQLADEDLSPWFSGGRGEWRSVRSPERAHFTGPRSGRRDQRRASALGSRCRLGDRVSRVLPARDIYVPSQRHVRLCPSVRVRRHGPRRNMGPVPSKCIAPSAAAGGTSLFVENSLLALLPYRSRGKRPCLLLLNYLPRGWE